MTKTNTILAIAAVLAISAAPVAYAQDMQGGMSGGDMAGGSMSGGSMKKSHMMKKKHHSMKMKKGSMMKSGNM